MATKVGNPFKVRDVSTAIRAGRRIHLWQAIVGVAAAIGLLSFVVVLPPGSGEIAVASASVQPLDVPPAGPLPPPPDLVAQGLAAATQALQNMPVPPGVQQNLASAMGGLQNLPANGGDAPSSDDDIDNSQEAEQQEAEQQQQDEWDQTQEQLNSDQQNDEQAELNAQQQAQEQNDEAQREADEGLQQAQQTEINANQ